MLVEIELQETFDFTNEINGKNLKKRIGAQRIFIKSLFNLHDRANNTI